jgi:uncharacterized membrane protein (DUF106 family)
MPYRNDELAQKDLKIVELDKQILELKKINDEYEKQKIRKEKGEKIMNFFKSKFMKSFYIIIFIFIYLFIAGISTQYLSKECRQSDSTCKMFDYGLAGLIWPVSIPFVCGIRLID